MTTKRELVAAALTEVGLAQYVFDISPERLQDALVRLNRMAAGWDALGIRTGYSFGNDIDAQAGIPDTLEECFQLQLGMRLAPTFGKAVSAETRVNAKNAYNAMLIALRQIPQVPMPGSMPMGAGNRNSGTGQQYFAASDEVPGLNEGATDY